MHSQLLADIVRRPVPGPAQRGFGDPQPRLNALGFHFEMKLHTPRPTAATERLIEHVIAGHEEISAVGEIEGILVSLEDSIIGLECAQQCVTLFSTAESERREA